MKDLVPEDHDPNEDASYAEFRFTFYEDGQKVDDEGNPESVISSSEMHVHGVAGVAVIDALLISARKIIADQMMENMFAEGVPETVRSQAADALAVHWLVHRIQSGALTSFEAVDLSVPDDASELFD